ncbi:MAG TPA: hypothetical protein VF681_11945, partial [Abditibacteriaceae bacterium]
MEVTTLGIGVDSSSVKDAAEELERLVQRSKKTEEQTQKLVDKFTIQAATLKLSTREAEMFKLALGNATDAQLKSADAALRAVEEHEKLNKSLKEARDLGDKIGKGIRTGITMAATAITTAVTAAIGYVVALDQIIKKTGELADISDKTMAPIEALVQMKTAADVAGVSMSSVGDAMNQMQRQLARGSDESKGAARGLAAIGIEIDKFRTLDPAAQFKLLAEKMADVENNGGKVAVIQDIIGRSGAQMLPFLKEFADKQNQITILTKEAVEQADEYADRQARSRSQLGQYISLVAVTATPVMTQFQDALRETIKAFFGIDEKTSDLANNKKIQEFARDAAMFLAHVADTAVTVANTLRNVGLGLGSLAAAAGVVLAADITSQESMKKAWQTAKDIHAEYDADVRKNAARPKLVDELKKQFDASDRVLSAEEKKMAERAKTIGQTLAKNLGGYTSSDGKKDGKAKEDPTIKETEKIIEAIRRRTEADEAQLSTGKKLTEFEKFATKTINDAWGPLSKLNDKQKERIGLMLAEAIQANERLEALKAHNAGVKQILESQKAWDDELAQNETKLIAQRKAITDS